MITEGEIIYNNKSSLKDLNLKLENYPTIPLSTEEYEETTIVSRKGQLIENTGTYKNKHVTFEFTINKNDEMLNFDEIYDWLLNIKDNRFFYWQTNRCLRVKKVKFGDFKQEFRTFGTITLEFIFEPFWEDSEPTITTLTEDGSIMYYGTAPSSPIIKVYGSGNIQININGQSFMVRNVGNYVTIDNNLMQVRDQFEQSKDFDSSGNFIEFETGEIEIELDSNVDKIEITYTNKWRG